MRKRPSPRPYLQVFVVLLALMSLPLSTKQTLQGVTIAILAPAWEQLSLIKKITGLSPNPTEKEIYRLQLENQLLANEIIILKETLQKEQMIDHEIKELLTDEERQSIESLRLIHKKNINQLIAHQLEAIPAEVLFRSPATWNNSFWINRGESHNEALGKVVISKNSPVVIGTSVVGVVDYVGNKQSRVRLITDPGLSPAVRAVREHDGKTWYLGKGELRGAIKPAWRKQSLALKGVGFNYDFPDSEGPARDLRTGKVAGEYSKQLTHSPYSSTSPVSSHNPDTLSPTLPIVKEGDHLITTGMDGVFPAGLQVATVTNVHLLKEGDYSYELEAIPAAKNLETISQVYILPPIGYEPI